MIGGLASRSVRSSRPSIRGLKDRKGWAFRRETDGVRTLRAKGHMRELLLVSRHGDGEHVQARGAGRSREYVRGMANEGEARHAKSCSRRSPGLVEYSDIAHMQYPAKIPQYRATCTPSTTGRGPKP